MEAVKTVTKREPMDRLLFIMILILLTFGLLMIYSASAVLGQKQSGNDAFFFERQLTYAVLGLFVMLFLSR
ncbi:MAG: FtsW/RodA/SpoVE family cell cycle protein, partial [Deltaproteobacteria bacterium]|nr:FtsW/RodA/SpoVE family cell cycle protein [Deltaproteobacteria bacterium]